MENNNNFQFDQNGGEQPQFGAPMQGEQPNQQQFGAPMQGEQPNQQQFGAPMQGNQPNQQQFGAPMQGNQPNQQQFGAPMQGNQPNQQQFGAPMQGNQPNQQQFGAPMQGNQPSARPAEGNKKKGMMILVITLVIVAILGITATIGVFAFTMATKSSKTPQTTQTTPTSNTDTNKTTEFTFAPSPSDKTIFKLQEVKRDVKVTKELANATVYIFDAENKGTQGATYFSMEGLTTDGGIVRPVYTSDVENSSILEDNNCKSSDGRLEKNEKGRICLVYPMSITKLLVPENSKKATVYRPAMIDEETSASELSVVNRKSKGQEISEQGYDGEIESTTAMSDVKEATDSYGSEIFAIDVTLTIKKDTKFASKGYENARVELEDGTFYREEYSDYKVEGSLSGLELSKKLSEPVKKDEVIHHTITFPKTEKKIKNVILCSYDYRARKEITTIFEQ